MSRGSSNSEPLAAHLSVSDLLRYGIRHGQETMPSLELASVLLGMSTAALILIIYAGLRPGIYPWTTQVQKRMTRLTTLSVVYALFLCLWTLLVKNTWVLFSGAWTGNAFNGALDISPVSFLFGPMLLECALFGSFSALVIVAIYIFAKQGLSSRAQRAMLAAALFTYAISLAHLAIEARYFAKFFTLSADEIEATTSTAQQFAPLALTLTNVVLSDAIVLWRMCALCGQHSGARLLSAVLLTSTVVVSVLNLIHDTASDSGYPEDHPPNLREFAYSFTVAALSLVTNLTSTIAVGWRTWLYRRDVSAHLAALSRKSVAEKVMALLVESGCIYCIAWVLYLVYSVETTIEALNKGSGAVLSLEIASYLNRLMPQLSGIYPTVIIVLVPLEQGILENALTESKLSAFVAARPAKGSYARRAALLAMDLPSGESMAAAQAVSSYHEGTSDRDGENPGGLVGSVEDGANYTEPPFHTVAPDLKSLRSVCIEPRQ